MYAFHIGLSNVHNKDHYELFSTDIDGIHLI